MVRFLSRRQCSRLFAIAVGGLLLLCGLRIVLVLRAVAGVLPVGVDANAYFAAARAMLHGVSPIGYGGIPFLPEAQGDIPSYLYPPFLGLVLVPLAILPYPFGLYLWLALVAATTLGLIFVLRPLVGWPVAIIGVLFFLPTWESLWLGQINALIAVIIAAMLRMPDQKDAGRMGLLLALGTLIKITPVLTGFVLLVQGRWRTIWIAALTGVAIITLSLPFVTLETWYQGTFYALQHTEDAALFVSWTAIVRRVPGLIGALGPLIIIVSMLEVTLWRARVVPLPYGLAAASLLPLLIAQIIWHYTAILALPALALLWQQNQRSRILAAITWISISLLGGYWQPVMLSICWVLCCWPTSRELV